MIPDLAAYLPLLAVAAARLDAAGRVVQGSRGFWRALGQPPDAQPGVVRHCFIQPDFATLLNAPADAQGRVHEGLLTLGEFSGRTRSLCAQVWRCDGELVLLAEFDIEELERVFDTTIALNNDYARAQLALVQANHQLQQREQRLRQLLEELTQAQADRRRAESQLRQAERLASIGTLAAGVAHEINNPISYVSANFGALREYLDGLFQVLEATEFALADSVCPPAARVRLEEVRRHADIDFIREDSAVLLAETREGLERVRRIAQALKAFARLDVVESWLEVDLNACLEACLATLADALSHCVVHRSLEALPALECVPGQLEQVFMHLLLNAAQAVKEHGEVWVSTRTTDGGETLVVEVRDSGHGITPEHLPHIFDPFFTTRAPGAGAGLGLSVAYGIVGWHHGQIEVESAAGQGSCFRVRLPRRQPAVGI